VSCIVIILEIPGSMLGQHTIIIVLFVLNTTILCPINIFLSVAFFVSPSTERHYWCSRSRPKTFPFIYL